MYDAHQIAPPGEEAVGTARDTPALVSSEGEDMYDDDATTDEPTTDDGKDSEAIRRLREDNRKLRKEVTDNSEALKAGLAAQRELAMIKAGINPQAPGAEWFMKGYDGELDPEKIREAGAAFVGQAPAAPQPPAPPAPTGYQNPNPYFAAAAAQEADAGGWNQAQAATAPQEPPGINHYEGLRQAAEKGGSKGVAFYMAQHGLPVVGNWNAQGGYEVQ